jgi:hypothetical protein
MKKSVYTFGLLASSLVMLAVIPFLNQNNNSFLPNVKAQEYGTYDDDYDNSYSTYPTDDKKYECRTGPFEGFFVSSVEFCKHVKFDDKDRKDIRDRDNRTGTQGPPSPQGLQGPPGINGTTGATGPQGERGLTGATGATGAPGEDGIDGAQGPRGFNGTDGVNGTQGPQGIEGPAGPSEIPQSKIYTRLGLANPGTSVAACDENDPVISGGFFITNPPATLVNFAKMDFGFGVQGWFTAIRPAGETTVTTQVTCFNNP